MKTKIVIALVFLVLVLGALGGIKALQIRKMIAAGATFSAPRETVSTFTVVADRWQGTLDAIGSVTAAQGVIVSPEIPGTVTEIAFESGTVVAKGALLIRLDTSSEAAQLRAVEAQVDLAQLNLTRIRSLRADKTVSESDLDTAVATLKQNLANADAIRSTIEKKTIRAPFAGRVGIRAVNQGQYLEAGKPIVSLQALTPIYVEFALPQQDLAHLTNGLRVQVTTDAYQDRPFEGWLTAINPDLDQATRSVSLQATLNNAEQLLRPGMFVQVRVLLPDQEPVVIVPITSVLSAPYGDSVYLVESTAGKDGQPSLNVRQQFIRSGRSRGDFVSIEAGVKPGDRVVSAGVFKLRNGMGVVENRGLVPAPEKAPHPADS